MSDTPHDTTNGYLNRKPDEGVYYKTVDKKGNAIIVAAERVGDRAQLAYYNLGEWVGGDFPMTWEDAQRIAQDQFETCERYHNARTADRISHR